MGVYGMRRGSGGGDCRGGVCVNSFPSRESMLNQRAFWKLKEGWYGWSGGFKGGRLWKSQQWSLGEL